MNKMQSTVARTVSEGGISNRSYRWYALGLLALAYGFNIIDRFVLSVIIEPVKHEFAVSDRAMGMLSGLSFTLPVALVILPMGWLIDRVNRRNLLTGILFVWSALTALSATAGSYISLLAIRMCVGAAEGGGSPCALSLLSDHFRPKERSTAIGIYMTATAFGTAASFAIGGYVAAKYGWRAAFLVAGLPGILLALIILATLREPLRGASDTQRNGDAESAPTLMTTLRFIIGHRPMMNVLLGMVLLAFVNVGVVTWTTSFFIRVHGLELRQAGIVVALAAGLFQSLGMGLAGFLADRWAHGAQSRLAAFSASVCILTVTFGLAAVIGTSDWRWSVALMLFTFLTFGSGLPPAMALLMNEAAPRSRGVVMATMGIATNLLGAGLGPLATGALSDAFGGSEGVSRALAVTLLFDLWAAAHFMLAARGLANRGDAALVSPRKALIVQMVQGGKP